MPLIFLCAIGLVSALTASWEIGIAGVLLWLVWKILPRADGPPVLAMALTFQWVQVFIGIAYFHLTGRQVTAMVLSDYEPMVWIGLGCIASLLLGLVIATFNTNQQIPSKSIPWLDFDTKELVAVFIGVTLCAGTVRSVAWQFPLVTQAILAVGFGRLALFYLIIRRLVRPPINLKGVALLLLFEILIGFSGFFANFKEGFILVILAFLERFDARRLRHWLIVGGLTLLALLAALAWTGIKTNVRRQYNYQRSVDNQLSIVTKGLSEWSHQSRQNHWKNVDHMVDRLWQVYYPALALPRVPAELPHTDGALLHNSVMHILKPRMFFPNKPPLPSESDMVREYSGIWVAGRERSVSIAFGYSAEMYIDFGLPWMFAPVFAFGLLVGLIYQWLMTNLRNREIAVPCTTVIMWISLYLFERSTIKTLGTSLTLAIFLGGTALFLDRWFFGSYASGRSPRLHAARISTR